MVETWRRTVSSLFIVKILWEILSSNIMTVNTKKKKITKEKKGKKKKTVICSLNVTQNKLSRKQQIESIMSYIYPQPVCSCNQNF